jgi:hypothetical protein
VKRIGLLGGMSWESSLVYYRLVNEAVRDRLGGLHSADCVLRSVDFAEIEALQRAGDWDAAGALLAREAVGLERAELPVGGVLQADVVLQLDRAADRVVLGRAERVGVDRPGLEVGAGLGQRGRAQEAADVVGAERRQGVLGHAPGC